MAKQLLQKFYFIFFKALVKVEFDAKKKTNKKPVLLWRNTPVLPDESAVRKRNANKKPK
jgi:hypothetical protein